jgi:hypothetical protein
MTVLLACQSDEIKRVSPMLLEELFTSIRQKWGRPISGSSHEEGAEITKRLHELLDFETPSEAAPPPSDAPAKTIWTFRRRRGQRT